MLERHGLPFDLLFYEKHLRHVPDAGRATAQPADGDRPSVEAANQGPSYLDDWLPHLQAAARYPNVFCKLSGMITEADWQRWTADDLKPYVQRRLRAFGAERCMYGSDWPVCELAGTYEQVFQALVDALGPISPAERAAIFGGTATRFYGLDV